MSTVALPSLAEILDSARVVSLPLAARFRGIETREALVFEGPEGWTEFSPFVEYADAEAATWLAGAIDFGWRPSPPAVRDRVAVNATMPAVAASEVPRILARYDGCRTVKVKVAEAGQTLAADVARVRAVREAMGPEGRVRVDANGAWNVDEAERAVHALAEFDLEYVEQPCAEIDELAELRERIDYLDIRSRPTRASARPPTPCVWRVRVPPIFSSSKLSPSAASTRRERSSRRRDCPPWCPAPSTPRSACRWGWRWRRRCPTSTTTADSAPPRCSRSMSWDPPSWPAAECCRSSAPAPRRPISIGWRRRTIDGSGGWTGCGGATPLSRSLEDESHDLSEPLAQLTARVGG